MALLPSRLRLLPRCDQKEEGKFLLNEEAKMYSIERLRTGVVRVYAHNYFSVVFRGKPTSMICIGNN